MEIGVGLYHFGMAGSFVSAIDQVFLLCAYAPQYADSMLKLGMSMAAGSSSTRKA